MRPMAAAYPVTGTGAVRAAAALYCGYALRATGGAAVVRIWDNPAAASGTLLDVVALAADASAQAMYDTGIDARRGVFVEVVSGTVEGSVRIG